MEKKIKVAAVGDNCVDAYDQTGEAFPGGNPVNVAVYTVRLGGEASYTGVVGDDAYGKLMKDSIAKKGVDVSHLKVMPGSTAVTHVEIIDGERILGDYEEGVMAEFKLSEEDIEFLGSHELEKSGYTVFCIDYRQSGIGSGRCGPQLAKENRLDDTHYTFSFHLKPEIL